MALLMEISPRKAREVHPTRILSKIHPKLMIAKMMEPVFLMSWPDKPDFVSFKSLSGIKIESFDIFDLRRVRV
jgi:hypothetical protein